MTADEPEIWEPLEIPAADDDERAAAVAAFDDACRTVNGFTVDLTRPGDTYGHALREALRLARIALDLPERPVHLPIDYDALMAAPPRPATVWGIPGSRSPYDYGSTPETTGERA